MPRGSRAALVADTGCKYRPEVCNGINKSGTRVIGNAVTAAALLLCPEVFRPTRAAVHSGFRVSLQSLVAVQQTPGWALNVIYYHSSVAAAGSAAAAREILTGRIPATVNVEGARPMRRGDRQALRSTVRSALHASSLAPYREVAAGTLTAFVICGGTNFRASHCRATRTCDVMWLRIVMRRANSLPSRGTCDARRAANCRRPSAARSSRLNKVQSVDQRMHLGMRCRLFGVLRSTLALRRVGFFQRYRPRAVIAEPLLRRRVWGREHRFFLSNAR